MAASTREPAGDKGTADRIQADDGHAWVRLVTKQAMDREGACMGHCIGNGGYDEYAGSEEMADDAIWSLRRPDGVSVLTAQVRYLELDYAKGPKNSDPGRFECLQVAHLVAGFKEAGHALKVDEDTGIVLLEDGRTFQVDRLPPDVVAARAEAARRLEEERAGPLASACNLVALRGQVFFRPAGSPSIRILGEGSPFEFVGGASSGYGPGGGGGAARVEERIERLEIRSNESPRRPIIDTLTHRSPLHFAMELTANEADPIVECWSDFNTGLETFRTRSGIRFSSGRQFWLMATGSQDLIQAYRAAIARAEAERASAQPPSDPVTFTASAIQADDILDLQFPDGRSAYLVRDVEVFEGDVPVTPDRYILDATCGMLMVLDDRASLTVRFRAGEQPVPVTIAPGLQVVSEPISFAVADPGTSRPTARWSDRVFRNARPLHLTGVQARIVDAVVTSVTPDGFEARWEGGPDTIEQALALVAPGPGKPTTAEPPA